MDVQGKQVVVVGLGSSGRAAASLALEKGATVIGTDLNTEIPPLPGVELVLGEHPIERVHSADLVILSPGVPSDQPWLNEAREIGVPIIGELGFASGFVRTPMIGITGTNGKSTVTSFVAQLAEHAGLKVFAGGNLGNPLSNAVRSDEKFDLMVVEVSSYQLENPGSFAPNAAVVLNLTPDHLSRHGDMENYGRTKCRIFERMTETNVSVLPFEHSLLREAASRTRAQRLWIGSTPGVRVQKSVAELVLSGDRHFSLDLEPLNVPGEHNRMNAAVAALLLFSVGISGHSLQEGIAGLKGLPHRMELVGEANGVRWINDSKATNVAATEAALKGMVSPVVLLLGGQAKSGDSFGSLEPMLRGHRGVVTFGASGDQIANELELSGLKPVRCTGMAEAVIQARLLSQAGDTVMLSPGCASFDEFRNFEHRGEVFASIWQTVDVGGVGA